MRRRSAVLALALSFGLFITGCDSGVSGPEDQPEAPAPKTSQQGPADKAELTQQLNTVREATKKYRDIEAAREEGYVAISPYIPGMGFHFAKPPEGKEEPDPFGTELENPGVLVYYTNGSYNPTPFDPEDPDPSMFHDPERDDDLILGAVEWLVPGDQEENPPNIFNDEDSPRNLNTTEEEGWHFEEAEDFTGLHAWVHRGNPAGVFHSTNPTIDPQTETGH